MTGKFSISSNWVFMSVLFLCKILYSEINVFNLFSRPKLNCFALYGLEFFIFISVVFTLLFKSSKIFFNLLYSCLYFDIAFISFNLSTFTGFKSLDVLISDKNSSISLFFVIS